MHHHEFILHRKRKTYVKTRTCREQHEFRSSLQRSAEPIFSNFFYILTFQKIRKRNWPNLTWYDKYNSEYFQNNNEFIVNAEI